MSDQLNEDNSHITSINPEQNNNMSRRDFLNLAGRAAVAGIAATTLRSSVAPAPQSEDIVENQEDEVPQPIAPFEEYPLKPTEVIFEENDYFEFENGEREVELSGMGWYPDGHIPFVTLSDKQTKLMWITGHISGVQGSFPYTWDGYSGIKPKVDENNIIVPGVTREQNDSNEAYRNGYSGLTSVTPFSGGLLGFTHNEQWQFHDNGAGFKASVGMVFSRDGGATFEPISLPITGRETRDPGKEVTGAGQPCAIKVKDANGQEYAYVYYIEWLPQEAKSRYGAVDQIYLSRFALNGNQIGAAEHLTNRGFRTLQEGEITPDLQPVMKPPSNIAGANYAALPGVSYNKIKQKFLMTFETDVGVCVAESADAVKWDNPQLVMRYPSPLSSVWSRQREYSYSYPTLLDLSQNNDSSTGENITMLLAEPVGPGKSHSLVAINGKLK